MCGKPGVFSVFIAYTLMEVILKVPGVAIIPNMEMCNILPNTMLVSISLLLILPPPNVSAANVSTNNIVSTINDEFLLDEIFLAHKVC